MVAGWVHGTECINRPRCRCSSSVPDKWLGEEGPCDHGNPTGQDPKAIDANTCQWSSQGARAHGQYPCHWPPSTCGYLFLYLSFHFTSSTRLLLICLDRILSDSNTPIGNLVHMNQQYLNSVLMLIPVPYFHLIDFNESQRKILTEAKQNFQFA